MPPRKERKLIEFNFDYEGKSYKFNGYQITDSLGIYICDCDITPYKMDYTEDNLRICCKVALTAYSRGFEIGQKEAKRKIIQALGIRG